MSEGSLPPFPPHREGESGDNASNPYAAPNFHTSPGSMPAPPQQNYYPPAGEKTAMPTVALVAGVLGLFIGFIFALTAIIVGFIGRSKAKRLGQPTGQATAGIILGFVGIVVNIIAAAVLISLGIFGFGNVQAGTAAADASVAANAYYAENGTYDGLTASVLPQYGWVAENNDVVVDVVHYGSDKVCVSGTKGTILGHVVSTSGFVFPGGGTEGAEMKTTVKGKVSVWRTGGCPAVGGQVE